jgi:hypothetical protein
LRYYPDIFQDELRYTKNGRIPSKYVIRAPPPLRYTALTTAEEASCMYRIRFLAD